MSISYCEEIGLSALFFSTYNIPAEFYCFHVSVKSVSIEIPEKQTMFVHAGVISRDPSVFSLKLRDSPRNEVLTVS